MKLRYLVLCFSINFLQGQSFFYAWKRNNNLSNKIKVTDFFKEICDYVEEYQLHPDQIKSCFKTFTLKELMTLHLLAYRMKKTIVQNMVIQVLDDRKYGLNFLNQFPADKNIQDFCSVPLETDVILPELLIPVKGDLCTVSSDGKFVLTKNSETQDLELISLETAETYYSFSNVTSALFSPAGTQLVLFKNNLLEIWNINESLSQHIDLTSSYTFSDTLGAIGYSPDSKWLAIRAKTNVEIWDVDPESTLTLVHSFPRGHNYDCIFSPDGNQIVTKDTEIKIWDAKTFSLLKSVTLPINSKVLYSPTGKQLIIGRKHAHVFDTKDFSVLHTFNLNNLFCSFTYSPDGKQIAIGGKKESLEVYDSESFSLMYTIENVQRYPILYSSDSRCLILRGTDEQSRIYNTQTGALLFSLKNQKVHVASDEYLITEFDKFIYQWKKFTIHTLGQFLFLTCIKEFLINHENPLVYTEKSNWWKLLSTFDESCQKTLLSCCAVRPASVLHDFSEKDLSDEIAAALEKGFC